MYVYIYICPDRPSPAGSARPISVLRLSNNKNSTRKHHFKIQINMPTKIIPTKIA